MRTSGLNDEAGRAEITSDGGTGNGDGGEGTGANKLRAKRGRTTSVRILFSILAIATVMPAQVGAAPVRRSVRLEVGASFQKAVDDNEPGTRFTIASGVHRLQSVRPKDGMVFTGETGAVMSGSRVLKSFAREGGLWVATGQTQQGVIQPNDYQGGVMLPGSERDNHPEELFIEGKRLRHVAAKSSVGPGEWFFDYPADKIYFADDPTGKFVETSVADYAFTGEASNVTIENLQLRQYATPTHQGTVNAANAPGWKIRRVDVNRNHAIGIRLGPGTSVRHSRVSYNGQMGLGGGRGSTLKAPLVIKNNEIGHNRVLGFNWKWEGGGVKITESRGAVFSNNWVHHNGGPGVWFDVYNYRATIYSNVVESNSQMGIYYEVSYGPTIIGGNTVRRNGTQEPGAQGAGIRIDNSRNVVVRGNSVRNNARGIMLTMIDREKGPDGRLELTNVKVTGNVVGMNVGTTGLIDETGSRIYYTSKGNVFRNNRYELDNSRAFRFSWIGGWSSPHTWQQWTGFGNDEEGEVIGPTESRSSSSVPRASQVRAASGPREPNRPPR